MAVAGGLFVTYVDSLRGDQPGSHGGGVGDDAYDAAAASDLFLQPVEGLIDHICGQCASGKAMNTSTSAWA